MGSEEFYVKLSTFSKLPLTVLYCVRTVLFLFHALDHWLSFVLDIGLSLPFFWYYNSRSSRESLFVVTRFDPLSSFGSNDVLMSILQYPVLVIPVVLIVMWRTYMKQYNTRRYVRVCIKVRARGTCTSTYNTGNIKSTCNTFFRKRKKRTENGRWWCTLYGYGTQYSFCTQQYRYNILVRYEN